MHEEQLNRASYALRGSSSRNAITSPHKSSPLCQTCTNNQTLQIHLLSNYLPPRSDPTYQELHDQLPAYKASLDLRYPPLCPNCRPLVEEEIERKDHMAKTTALGGFLKQSRMKAQQRVRRRASQQLEQSQRRFYNRWTLNIRQLTVWRIQTVLWCLTTLSSLTCNILFAVVPLRPNYVPFRIPHSFALVPLAMLSNLWSEWDPTYPFFLKAKHQGRDVKLIGRSSWVGHQRKLLVLRSAGAILCTCMDGMLDQRTASALLAIEVILIWLSIRCLHISERPRIVVSSRSASRVPTPSIENNGPQQQPPPEVDIISSLTLSSNPLSTIPRASTSSALAPPQLKPAQHTKPVFGQTSLAANSVSTSFTSSMTMDGANDGTEMDWMPSPSATEDNVFLRGRTPRPMEEENWLKPQRFFGTQQDTGLETLFDSANWLDDKTQSKLASAPVVQGDQTPRSSTNWIKWTMVVIGAVLFLLIGYMMGRSSPAAAIPAAPVKLVYMERWKQVIPQETAPSTTSRLHTHTWSSHMSVRTPDVPYSYL
ncbi:hypothetical protein FRC03_000431 [Tulasnella sp. 419]|nr:hypothetical protein FRC03_000431 [Tulasnella sp. 419]